MPRISKKFALLLVLAMLATMFVGMGTVSASASYSVGSLMAVNAGPDQDLGKIKISVPTSEVNNGDFFTVRLPSDFDFNLPTGTDVYLTNDTTGAPAGGWATNEFALSSTQPTGAGGLSTGTAYTKTFTAGTYAPLSVSFPQVNNGFLAPTTTAAPKLVLNALSENEVKVTIADTGTKQNQDNAYFYINLYHMKVDSSSPASITASITGKSGSPFVDGSLAIATYGTGTTNLSIDSVKTITDSSKVNAVDNIRIKEDRPGAWKSGDTIKLKLPSGFVWNRAWDANATPAGYKPNVSVTAIDNGTCGIPATLTPTVFQSLLEDNGRTLKLTSGLTTTAANYFMISGLGIDVDDESVAKTGDVVVNVSGTATAAPGSFTAVKYGDYSVSAYAVGDPLQVVAGGVQQRIGKFAIEESVKGSLPTNKTIIATLVGGAKWDVSEQDGPTEDTSTSKNWQSSVLSDNWVWSGTTGDAIKLTVGSNNSTDAIKAVFEKGEIAVSPDAESEIKIVFSGSAGVSEEVVVANVIKPATISTDGGAVQSPIGLSSVKLNPILITENVKEGINFDPNGDQKTLRIEFPVDVVPSMPTSVTVTAGDVTIDTTAINKTFITENNAWGINIPLKSTSSTPATIKVEGVTLDVSRSVPQGDVVAKLKGSSVVKTAVTFGGLESSEPGMIGASAGGTDKTFSGKTTLANAADEKYFSGVGTISETPVVTITTQAPANTIKTSKFVVGSTTYTVGDQEQTMDVAPYIKNSRTYVPVAYLANALGVDINNILWDAGSQTVTLMRGDGKIVQLKIGSQIIYINGVPVTMDVAPEITGSRTFLPAGFVAQAFGALVSWDAATNTVTIQP